jgi:hypothetical protein
VYAAPSRDITTEPAIVTAAKATGFAGSGTPAANRTVTAHTTIRATVCVAVLAIWPSRSWPSVSRVERSRLSTSWSRRAVRATAMFMNAVIASRIEIELWASAAAPVTPPAVTCRISVGRPTARPTGVTTEANSMALSRQNRRVPRR